MTPLLFMGQEWAASTPFLFFTDHDAELGRLVAEGRRAEFSGFSAFADPEVRARIPDPQAEATFGASRLKWEERGDGEHARSLALYECLIRLRTSDPVLRVCSRRELTAHCVGDVLAVRRRSAAGVRWLFMNFGDVPAPLASLAPSGGWTMLLRSDLGPLDGAEVPKHTAVVIAT